MSSQEVTDESPPVDDQPAEDTDAVAGDGDELESRAPETPAGDTADGSPDGSPDGSDDEKDDEKDDDDEPLADDQRLERLDERIAKARAQADDAGVLVDDDDEEEEYVDSGATEEEDDQTITPPG